MRLTFLLGKGMTNANSGSTPFFWYNRVSPIEQPMPPARVFVHFCPFGIQIYIAQSKKFTLKSKLFLIISSLRHITFLHFYLVNSKKSSTFALAKRTASIRGPRNDLFVLGRAKHPSTLMSL